MANRNAANYIPVFKDDEVDNSSETWVSGNTKTISNKNVRANSFILIMWTSSHSGGWYLTVSDGQFIITNEDALTNVTFKYRII